MFELDHTIFPSNRKLLKLLRHTYLQHAPVLHSLSQHFQQLSPKQRALRYPNGPFACTHHIATLCLQQQHSRAEHLRQLGLTRYLKLQRPHENISQQRPSFTPPSRPVAPFSLGHIALPIPPTRHTLTPLQTQSFLQTSLSTNNWTQSPTITCSIRLTNTEDIAHQLRIPDNILRWQFEESFHHHHHHLLESLHREHLTPPRPTDIPHNEFTSRQILPTSGTHSLTHDLFVSDQIAGLMLCPTLSLGSSSLTFAQAASWRDGQFTVDIFLQPFISSLHIRHPPIKTHTPRPQRRRGKPSLSCPFGSTPLRLICSLSHCRNCNRTTKTLRAHALANDWITQPLAGTNSGHTPQHVSHDRIILRLTPLAGP